MGFGYSFSDHPSYTIISNDGEEIRYVVSMHGWGRCCKGGHTSRKKAAKHGAKQFKALLDMSWEFDTQVTGSLANVISHAENCH